MRNVARNARNVARSTAVLSVLAWLILPALVELRPPAGWDAPPGTVLNADPGLPLPMALHDGLSEAFVEALDPESMMLLPGPEVHVAAASLLEPMYPPARTRIPRAADLLTLHRRRNE